MIPPIVRGVSLWTLGVAYQVSPKSKKDSFIKGKKPSPPSNNFPEPKLFRRPEEFFPKDLTKEEEKRLRTMQQFCEERHIDFHGVLNLSSRIPTKTTSERLDALAIVSLLLSVKKGKANKFYQANKAFIDTVLAKIEEGKLEVKDKRSSARDTELGVKAEYNSQQNDLWVLEDFDPALPLRGGSIVHELFHFYQDIQKLPLSVLAKEEVAYVKEGEYIVRTTGLTKPKQEAAIEKLFEQSGEGGSEGDKAGVYVAYYQAIGDSKQAEIWREKLRYKITSVTFTEPGLARMIERIGPKVKADMDKAIEKFQRRTMRQGIDRTTIEELSKRLNREQENLTTLANALKADLEDGKRAKVDVNELANKANRYSYQWFYNFFWKEVTAIRKAGLNSGADIPSLFQQIGPKIQTDIDEPIRFLHSLRFYDYFPTLNDGVD